MVSLAEVARRANVSKMTVSRVLNHPEKVSQSLRELVEQAMKDLNYRPNIQAQALAQKRTRIIQVMILEEMALVEPYYAALLAGIAQAAQTNQYSMQLATAKEALSDQCDGYIVMGARQSDYEWLASLTKPLVLFGENKAGFSFVDTDNRAATYQASLFAHQQGYDQLIYVGLDLEESFAHSRQAGYVAAMEDLGCPPQLYKLENRSRVSQALLDGLELSSDVKTAFICGSDRLALGLVRGLEARGKRIPEEVGVIGFDGFFLDKVSRPSLTTMEQPLSQMGQACLEQLLLAIQSQQDEPTSLFFPAKLIQRETTL
ncbi:LacI family DNA-binding transcriptional regulator [Streptococcus suis]|nr:LacI family DNA-binding transcriptional regulator [Streptococcus suis]